MINKQLDKLTVPKYTGGAVILAFFLGYIIGVALF
jgi:hypothetical protein